MTLESWNEGLQWWDEVVEIEDDSNKQRGGQHFELLRLMSDDLKQANYCKF
ncbi:hypothetical protein SFC07_08820 [Corynebacterium callunae]|uniref:hypothetical protein n=1 Tax=Corynebacterium callunae TaxID=1721 RepID=UPI0039825DB3